MVKTPSAIFVAAWALLGTASAAYPATFPFENEVLEIAFPPAATPSHTYDDEDPGGYYHTYIVELTKVEPGHAFANNGMTSHMYVTEWDEVAVKNDQYYNCTTSDPSLYFNELTYTFDEIAGTTYCDSPKECCLELRGKVKYFWDADMEWDKGAWEEWYEKGLCTESFHYDAFCSLFNDYAVIYCNEQIVTDTEREINTVCFDSYLRAWLHCPIFVNTKDITPGSEPMAYLESMTSDEYNAHTSLWLLPDKVCLPYSYYFPETGKAEGSSDGADTKENVSDSAAAAVVAGFAGLAMIVL